MISRTWDELALLVWIGPWNGFLIILGLFAAFLSFTDDDPGGNP